MMYLLCVIILFLYLRTWAYKWNIDDHVPRAGMFDPDMCPPPRVPTINGVRFDDMRRSYLATFTNIGIYLLCAYVINELLGWRVALLWSVIPSNVSGVAWARTGNYYMTTCFLILVSYYCLILQPFPYSWLVSYFLFFGALHSTISALPFLVIAWFLPMGWTLTIPAIIFLTGKRFRSGLAKRKQGHEKQGIMTAKITWRNPILVWEVMAYYILLATGFMPLGFFHTYGRRGRLWKVNMYALSTLVLVGLFCWFGLINPFGLAWWLLFMGIFCHAIPNLGQFVTERYMYIANIGFCLILCSFFEHIPELYWVLVGVWFMITYNYIPAWRSNEALFAHGITSFPDCEDNYVNLSSLYMEKGQFFQAINPLTCALKYTVGRKYKLWGNLAKCYAVNAFYDKAYHCCQEALKDASPDQVDRLHGMMRDLKLKINKVKHNQKLLKKKGII